MKGSSEVIMGTTLVMVASLAIVLGLVLVLLAELYCSLLLRRRQRHLGHTTSSLTTTATGAFSHPKQTKPPDQPASALPLTSFYAQGVLQAPRSFLFPALPNKEVKASMTSQQPQAHQAREFQDQLELSSTPHRLGLLNPSPSSPSFVSPTSPHSILKVSLHCGNSRTSNRVTCGGGGEEHFMYISNPIYDNEASMPSRLQDTPFETPDISPSRLDMAISSDDKERSSSPSSPSSLPSTPPLTPMKKLPAEACSVSLRDARSLATSGSDSNTIIGVSSSSSGSPCTSPSCGGLGWLTVWTMNVAGGRGVGIVEMHVTSRPGQEVKKNLCDWRTTFDDSKAFDPESSIVCQWVFVRFVEDGLCGFGIPPMQSRSFTSVITMLFVAPRGKS